MTAGLALRSRLALAYTGLVAAAGALLLGLMFLVLAGTLRLSRPVADHAVGRELRAGAITELLAGATLALLAVTALAGLTGWLLAGRLLRPVRAVSATAQRLSAADLSARVPVGRAADELATLAVTVNGMLDRIQYAVADRDRVLDSQRLFVANAAHELRTPLATIRTAVDVTLDGEPTRADLLAMAADVGDAVDTGRRTLDGLLILARSQAGPLRRVPVDLAAIASTAVASTTVAVAPDVSASVVSASVVSVADVSAADVSAADGAVTVRSALEPAPVNGEPVLLERMAGNLVENAVRHNHPGGRVTVESGVRDGLGYLRVVNTGAPITPDEQRRLFEPFVRGTAGGHRGAGLGLSIVRAVVSAHGGELVSTVRDGGGMDITVRIPR